MVTEPSNLPAATNQSETSLSEDVLVETPDDIRALQALSLYGRRLPIPLIQQQLDVSRATAYRLIAHGKKLVHLDPKDAIPKAILLLDEFIRESLVICGVYEIIL